ncbi:MAG: hypothetical protein HC893_11695 [Chloroflexaceae bacterium]|nr:hypothetical protein [Chloroflexaceae bacterium]
MTTAKAHVMNALLDARMLVRGRMRFYEHFLTFVRDFYIDGKMPIIVYSMGKTGTTSLAESLQHTRGAAVYHIHRMNMSYAIRSGDRVLDNKAVVKNRLGAALYSHVIKRGKPAKMNTLVRDPARRNISGFFQSFRNHAQVPLEHARFSMDEMIRIFLERYPHDTPITWFDQEVKPMLGIDVYGTPFPREQGHLVLTHGQSELLILKGEVADTVKEQAIAAFLNLPSFRLMRSNVAETYAELYRQFLHQIRLSNVYLDPLYTIAAYTPLLHRCRDYQHVCILAAFALIE